MDEMEHRLEQRRSLYAMFASLFLDLPDREFVDMVRGLDVDPSETGGSAMLAAYVLDARERSAEDVLRELRVDRTYLLNGAVREGARPPYESAFLGLPPQQVIGDLNLLYNREGYGLARTRSEQSDHIGKELGFMQMYCERELENGGDASCRADLRKRERAFFEDHLGPWMALFAQELQKHAQTDFYRAIGLFLEEHAREEAQVLQSVSQ